MDSMAFKSFSQKINYKSLNDKFIVFRKFKSEPTQNHSMLITLLVSALLSCYKDFTPTDEEPNIFNRVLQ